MTQKSANHALLDVRSVSKRFGPKPDVVTKIAIGIGAIKPASVINALDNVTLSVKRGEVLGIVGESGCGKSTLGRIIAGILAPSSGKVLWKGVTAEAMSAQARKSADLAVQMIFQNPMAALNPRMSIEAIVGEAPRAHGMITADRAAYVDKYLQMAGFYPSMKKRLPHEFSGGQRQRVNIARALAVNPELLVCDESLAALDVSIQAQILNLFGELRNELDLTYLFISHDLGVVEHISDRVVIMYLGRVVEEASVDDIFRDPNHPYTQALIAEIPRVDPHKQRFKGISGELPSPLSPPSGCHFHTRCPFAMKLCRFEVPELKSVSKGHRSACHLNDSS